MIRSELITLIILFFLMSSCAHKSIEVDMILHNAVVYTVNESGDKEEAIAILDGKILDVGPEHHILNKYKANQVIDLQHKTVYPGFIDAHCHFIQYGLNANRPDFSSCKSFEQVIERIEPYASDSSKHWLIGTGWDNTKWENTEFPEKSKLDELFPDRPVLLKRVDLHVGLANQVALDLAGIHAASVFDGGEVGLDDGKLTGILKDEAYNALINKIPPESVDEYRAALQRAEQDCFSVGLTTVSDAALDAHEVDLIQDMQDAGDLRMRIYAMLMDKEANYNRFLDNGPFENDRLHVAAFKYFLDGALGSRGAALKEPYSDDPENKGLLLYEEDYLLEKAALLKEKGWQMNAHCIGDSAVTMMLDVIQRAMLGKNEMRWRIEHAQMVSDEDLERFRLFDVIPSVQPTHATSDRGWVTDRIGEKRLAYSYIYRDLMEETGMIACGTDFPVEKINPIYTFYSAVFSKAFDQPESDPFKPKQTIDRISALKSMTIWAAFANGEEKNRGSIEIGKHADLVILDRDIIKSPEEYIPDTQIEYTILGGEVVYQR